MMASTVDFSRGWRLRLPGGNTRPEGVDLSSLNFVPLARFKQALRDHGDMVGEGDEVRETETDDGRFARPGIDGTHQDKARAVNGDGCDLYIAIGPDFPVCHADLSSCSFVPADTPASDVSDLGNLDRFKSHMIRIADKGARDHG